MDLSYYESPPGLQLLHCRYFDENVAGGASYLYDAHALARVERFDTSSSALLRELDESDRFVQKSAESTSIWPS